MTIVAHAHPFVIGADTHARNHALSILASPNGEVIDDAQFPATTAGLTRAVAWVSRRTGADLDVLWVIEGTGTYGAQLARAAANAGYSVVEAARMNARGNRGVGKSDPLDARAEQNLIGFIPWGPVAAGDLAKTGGPVDDVVKATGASTSPHRPSGPALGRDRAASPACRRRRQSRCPSPGHVA